MTRRLFVIVVVLLCALALPVFARDGVKKVPDATPAESVPATSGDDAPRIAKDQTRLRPVVTACPPTCPEFQPDPGWGGGGPAPCVITHYCGPNPSLGQHEAKCRANGGGCRYQRSNPTACESCG